MSPEENQRRQFPRVPSANAVLVNRLGELPAEEFAVTRSVGLGGCSFISSESFGVGSHLKVLITVNLEVIEVRAKVVYENQVDGGRYEIGVRFVGIAEEDRSKIASLFEIEG
jgi:hypothetical protein